MKKIFKKFAPKKQHSLVAEPDVVGSKNAPASQSTSNPIPASTTSHPIGCEILFEGATPIVAE
jgi:hypothetical protein